MSDVVSFTLVFSTIIFMIGVVTVTGIGTLGDVQAGTESNVAEETMRNYASTLADHREGADRRSVTVKLQGHSLERVNATVGWNVSGENRNNISTGALVRTTDTDADLVYESGALFRVEDGGGGVVVRQSPFRCGDRTAHLAVTAIEGDFSIASDRRVTLESFLVNQSITTRDANNVTVYLGGAYRPDQWSGALAGDWVAGTGDEYTCKNIDRVVVHETTVRIEVVR
ncbi:hypothetical protein BRC76_02185 [Halobacteriales archaeon QH_8_67_36]|nr:MAG: hypothetical protein BRC76_02185 [Halobacteriales archaeon QH_8_67_36]